MHNGPIERMEDLIRKAVAEMHHVKQQKKMGKPSLPFEREYAKNSVNRISCDKIYA